MVITPKPSWSNELVSMLSLLEFITPARRHAPDGAKPDLFSLPGARRATVRGTLGITHTRTHTHVGCDISRSHEKPNAELTADVSAHLMEAIARVHVAEWGLHIQCMSTFQPGNRTKWGLLISMSWIWQLTIFCLSIKWSGASHSTGVGTIFETVKSSLGDKITLVSLTFPTFCQ